MKPFLPAVLLLAAFAAPAAATPQASDPFFGPRTRYGYGTWLADFGQGPALGVTEVVVAFAAGREPGRAVVMATHAKGRPGYAKAGLIAAGPDAPPRVVSLKGELPTDAPFLALSALGPQHKLVGSAPVPATAGERVASLLGNGRVPTTRASLVFAHRYHAPKLPEIVDVFVGEPTWNPGGKTMKQVRVRRHTFVGGRIMATKAYTRRADRQEHVDVDPPVLTRADWAETAEATLGFVGLTDGRWYRLLADQGFEGVSYRVEQVGSGAIAYDAYHYTPH